MSVLYSEIRKDIKTGDLLVWDTEEFSSFFGFVLFLYQKILKAKFTHVGVVVRMGERLFLVEATPPEVRLVPISMFDDFYIIHTDMRPDQRRYLKFLFSAIGKKYSLVDLVKSIFKVQGSSKDYYCSELASDFYNSFGYISDPTAGQTPDSIVFSIMEKTGTAPTKVFVDKGNLT